MFDYSDYAFYILIHTFLIEYLGLLNKKVGQLTALHNFKVKSREEQADQLMQAVLREAFSGGLIMCSLFTNFVVFWL